MAERNVTLVSEILQDLTQDPPLNGRDNMANERTHGMKPFQNETIPF